MQKIPGDDQHPIDASHKDSSTLQKVASSATLHRAVWRQATPQLNRVSASQTLVQPDLSSNLVLPEEIPLPSFVMWSPGENLVEIIAPPPPREAASDVRPSIDLPNRELNLADTTITPSTQGVETLPTLPGSTSPVAVSGPDLPKRVPETAANFVKKPTPARVMSVSDLRMIDGTVPLPPVNQMAPAHASEGLAIGRYEGSALANNRPGSEGNAVGAGSGTVPSTKRIVAPKNGKFGMVVVGTSLDELYPETAGVWSGRLAYTVYLHVGLARSWILQYSQPRSAEAPTTGAIAHVEPPWPTDMTVPNLTGTIDADALLVHGFLSKEGRFEKLTVVFPPEFALSKFVLDALQQWQFRPARQDGQPAPLELLLIIPKD